MADRLLNAFNSSSQSQHSNPELNALLLSGGAALSELLNTQLAHTQVETPKDSIPKWVMGPSATNATLTSDRGSPGDPNSTTTYTNSPNAPHEQAERQARREVVQKNFTSFTTTMSKNAGEGLKKDLVANDATDMFNNTRGASAPHGRYARRC